MENLDAIMVVPEPEEQIIVPRRRRYRSESLEPQEFRVPTPILPFWTRTRLTFYNPETHKFLGRTPAEWKRLFFFYLAFYMFLATVCFISFGIFFLNLDDEKPRLQLRQSLIGSNPGLGFVPISDDTQDGALISFNINEPKSVKKWVDLVDKFLVPYKAAKVGCANFQLCNFHNHRLFDNVCLVDIKHFGPCGPQNLYGYKDNASSPCVFIKLNRIVGWRPNIYKILPPEMPQDLVDHINNLPERNRSQAWITCGGEYIDDDENIEEFRYFPGMGFPRYFYPYRNTKNYLSPLIAVQLVDLKPDVLVNIECRAWAENIFYGSRNDRQGSVRFQIYRGTK